MSKIMVEMNFCRRCGSALSRKDGPAYVCTKGHIIFSNASPAIGLILFNDEDKVLILKRSINPGKGLLDIPGGFCDGPEKLEDALYRELKEEVGLSRTDYTEPQYVLSGIDPYGYGGEILPVCAVVFFARLITAKQPVAMDDAASAEWIKLKDIDLSKVHFPVVRVGLEHIIRRQARA